MKLKNKVVVITGASSGLGEKIAYKVIEEGAKVALIARTEKNLKKVRNKIVEQENENVAEYFVCDVRNPEQIKSCIKKILKRFGKIDVLVNNAGVWTDEGLEEKNPSLRKVALETNILGHINFTYEVLPYFKKLNKGYIFNVISTSGVGDIPSGDNVLWKTYGATKWAMAGFTNALRDELKESKIKVTGFFPGGFDSMLYETAGRPHPHNQPWMMKAEDLADIVVFILTRPENVLVERIVVSKI